MAGKEQAPCREPDVGFDLGIPGSCPGLKADARPLSHLGVPNICLLKVVSPHIKSQYLSSLLYFALGNTQFYFLGWWFKYASTLKIN